ncbi:hypothetical protein [Roseobacter denitrificans]|uniref:hypothetical protein n=1 Tax=Roseobacter denitrificans TaxID=2434 RepID=UPI001C0C2B3A|nr:hypothetical protein [Roseobacter denitrificans]
MRRLLQHNKCFVENQLVFQYIKALVTILAYLFKAEERSSVQVRAIRMGTIDVSFAAQSAGWKTRTSGTGDDRAEGIARGAGKSCG